MNRSLRWGLALIMCTVFVSGYSTAQWVNGQAATVVLGQANFVSLINSRTDSTFDTWTYGDGGVLYDPQHAKLYVFDLKNDRVLRFAYPPGGFSANQPKAEAVLGQPNFASADETIDAQHMNTPLGGDVLDDTLWVADAGNARVLGFYGASTKTSGSSADVVIGEPNFTTNVGGVTASRLNNPSGVAIDRQTRDIYIADYNGERVLKFNHNNKSTSASADLVFGQSDFTSDSTALTPAGLNGPWKVMVYKNSLFVTDFSNGRVLRYDNLHSISSNKPAASVVFGQADFTSCVTGLSQSLMTDPAGIAVDSTGRLYVTDYSNARVMIYSDALVNSNTPNAANVLGQPNFVSATLNTSSSGLTYPDEITIDNVNKKVYVFDAGNNRAMQFTEGSALPVELVSFRAVGRNGAVELLWATATEQENFGFDVERRVASSANDLAGWTKIGFVEGAGSSQSKKTYAFVDHPAAGKILYRLKQIDRNGNYTYSNQVEMNSSSAPSRFALEQNFPNPFNPSTVISYEVPFRTHVTLAVFNTLGQKVAELVDEERGAGTYEVRFEAAGLSSGIYVYRMQAGSFAETKRFVLMK